MIVLILAAGVWLVLVATRRRMLMLIASVVLVGAWLWSAPAQPALSKAAALPPHSYKGSCASLEAGMTLDAVKKHMGAPDETRADEETRGPGATMLIYRNSRCAVHLLDGQVEFVD